MGAYLAKMQLISKFNEVFLYKRLFYKIFLLCVIDIYNKYAWIKPLEDKKVLPLLLLFTKYG